MASMRGKFSSFNSLLNVHRLSSRYCIKLSKCLLFVLSTSPPSIRNLLISGDIYRREYTNISYVALFEMPLTTICHLFPGRKEGKGRTYFVGDDLQEIDNLVIDGVDRVVDDRIQRFLTMFSRNFALIIRQGVQQLRQAQIVDERMDRPSHVVNVVDGQAPLERRGRRIELRFGCTRTAACAC